jgi:hypothetical protein
MENLEFSAQSITKRKIYFKRFLHFNKLVNFVIREKQVKAYILSELAYIVFLNSIFDKEILKVLCDASACGLFLYSY